jgi:tellurite methyltransferase
MVVRQLRRACRLAWMAQLRRGLLLLPDGHSPGHSSVTLSVQEQFGQIDIYVFDQILRGNIAAGMRVLDAGCGYGRNLVHLLREGCEVFAVDADAAGVEHVRRLSASLNTGLPAENFQVGQIEQMPFPDEFADVVICNSVLHFSRDERHFRAILAELWRVLRPGGMLFCRLGSRIGMDFERLRENIYRVGDGSEWFLVDEAMLLKLTGEMNAVLVDPLKTTIVQDYRCMTTWVVRKRGNFQPSPV